VKAVWLRSNNARIPFFYALLSFNFMSNLFEQSKVKTLDEMCMIHVTTKIFALLICYGRLIDIHGIIFKIRIAKNEIWFRLTTVTTTVTG
jgi:hypothetical protein